jgi:hypothetical protein
MALVGGSAKFISDKNRLRYQMRFTIKVAIIAVLIALVIQPVYARLSPQDDSVRAAFELLLKAGKVNDQAVGIAGARTKEYDAFETLWKAGKSAEDYALKLVLDETPAAQVYGAILLLELDEAAARREFQRLREETSTVMIWSGCVGRQETVGALVRKLERGEMVIFTPTGMGVRRK